MPLTRRRFIANLATASAGSVILGSLPALVRRAAAAGTSAVAQATPAASDIIVRSEWPEHWETTIAALGRAPITPNSAFFVRSHFPVPDVDAGAYRLEVTGLVERPITLTLAELRGLPTVEAEHTLECAGNGRGLFALPNTSGTQWGYGAVGNAAWRGVRLGTLLERAGVKPEAKHIWFEAADHAPMPATPAFLRSIPVEKAMRDVLLAHTMNGAPLPRLHGAPLRAIVPGWYAMASAKWVTRIRVEAAPSDNHFMVRGYRWTYPGEDPAQAKPVEEMRVKSVVTRPLQGARVPAGNVTIRGIAWAGPAGVARVEISTDGGRTWRDAELEGEVHPAAWRTWAATTRTTPGTFTVMSRATDGAGEVQPLAARVNAGGYGNNSIHRVTVHVHA